MLERPKEVVRKPMPWLRLRRERRRAIKRISRAIHSLKTKGEYIHEHEKEVTRHIEKIKDPELLRNVHKNIDVFRERIEKTLELLNKNRGFLDESMRKKLELDLLRLMVLGSVADSKAHLELLDNALALSDKLPPHIIVEIATMANTPYNRIAVSREKWPHIELNLIAAEPAARTALMILQKYIRETGHIQEITRKAHILRKDENELLSKLSNIRKDKKKAEGWNKRIKKGDIEAARDALQYFMDRKVLSADEVRKTLADLDRSPQNGLRKSEAHIEYVLKVLEEFETLRSGDLENLRKKMRGISLLRDAREEPNLMSMREYVQRLLGTEHEPSKIEKFWESLSPTLRKRLRKHLKNMGGIVTLAKTLENMMRSEKVLEAAKRISKDDKTMPKFLKLLASVPPDVLNEFAEISLAENGKELIDTLYIEYINALKEYGHPHHPFLKKAIKDKIYEILERKNK